MTHELQRITFDDFVRRPQEVLDRVRRCNEPVLIEQNGDVFRVELQEPRDVWDGYDPDRVPRALSASRGMFAGTDRDEFLREINEQREQAAGRFD
jgi:hypothetical protein